MPFRTLKLKTSSGEALRTMPLALRAKVLGATGAEVAASVSAMVASLPVENDGEHLSHVPLTSVVDPPWEMPNLRRERLPPQREMLARGDDLKS
jgi:hypothetical protein